MLLEGVLEDLLVTRVGAGSAVGEVEGDGGGAHVFDAVVVVPEEFVEEVLGRGAGYNGTHTTYGAHSAVEFVGLNLVVFVVGDDGDFDFGDGLFKAVVEVEFEAKHVVGTSGFDAEEEYLVAVHALFGTLDFGECLSLLLLEGVVGELTKKGVDECGLLTADGGVL